MADKNYEVNIGGKKYRVTAPDADTAYAWATESATSKQAPPASATGAEAPTATQGGALATPVPPAAARAPVKPVELNPDVLLKDELGKNGFIERNVASFGAPLAEAYQSVKQLFGGEVSDSDIKAQRAIADAGTTGNVAGNLAMYAVPGAKAERLIAGGKAAPSFLRRAIASMGVGGAQAGLLDPVLEDESRTENAAKGVAVAGGVSALGRTLSGLVKPSKSAQQIMDKGGQPTIGQGGEGVIGKTLGYMEDLISAIPGLGRLTGSSRERAEREVLNIAARRGSPYGGAADISRGEFFVNRGKEFDKSYKDILDNEFIPTSRVFRKEVRDAVDNGMIGASPEAKAEVEKILKDNYWSKSGAVTGHNWHEVQKEIRRLQRKNASDFHKSGARDSGKISETLDAVDDVLLRQRNAGLAKTPEKIKQLENVDEAWGHHKILEHASDYASAAGEKGVTLQHLAQAVEAKTPSGMKSKAAGRFQDITEPAATVFPKATSPDALERRASNIASNRMLAAAGAGGGYAAGGATGAVAVPVIASLVSGALATKTGSKLAMGNTKIQKKIAEKIRGRTGTASIIARESADKDEEE